MLPGETCSKLVWRRSLLHYVLQSGCVLNIGVAAGRAEAEEGTRGNEKTILVRYTVFYWLQSVFPTSPLKFCLEKNPPFFFFLCWACDYKWECKHVCDPLESHFLHSCIELGFSKHGKVFSEISFFSNVSHQAAAGIQRVSILINGEKYPCQTECWIPGGHRLKREVFWQLIEI